MKPAFTQIAVLLLAFLAISCNKDEEPIEFLPEDDGLIAFYPFDKDVTDASKYNNHCIDSTEGVFVEGVRGRALSFNGKTDYLKIGNTLNASNGFSFSFWMKSYGAADGDEDLGTIIAKYNASSKRSFYINSFGQQSHRDENMIDVSFFPDGSDFDMKDRLISNSRLKTYIETHPNPDIFTFFDLRDIQLNGWEHVVINLTETELQIYLNAELICKKEREYDEYFNSSGEPTLIGNRKNGTKKYHFHGLLDDLRIYNRALSDKEISNLYEFVDVIN